MRLLIATLLFAGGLGAQPLVAILSAPAGGSTLPALLPAAFSCYGTQATTPCSGWNILNGGTTSGVNNTGATLEVVAVTTRTGSCGTFNSSTSDSYTLHTQGFVNYYYVFNPGVSATKTYTCLGSNQQPVISVLYFSGTFAGTAEGYSGNNVVSTSGQPGSTGALTGVPNEVCVAAAGVSLATSIAPVTANSSYVSAGSAANSSVDAQIYTFYLVPAVSTALNPTISWSGSASLGLANQCFK